MNRIASLLNSQQWKTVGGLLLGSTGPFAWLLSKKLGMSDADTKMWLDFIAAVTSLFAGAIITATQTNAAQVQAVAAMPTADKATHHLGTRRATRLAAAAAAATAATVIRARRC